eukprot:4432107-Prymnesium_polylepis.1
MKTSVSGTRLFYGHQCKPKTPDPMLEPPRQYNRFSRGRIEFSLNGAMDVRNAPTRQMGGTLHW